MIFLLVGNVCLVFVVSEIMSVFDFVDGLVVMMVFILWLI